MVLEGAEVRDGVATWVPVPLGLESPPPAVKLAAAEGDGLVEGMFKSELFAGEAVATAEDDPSTDVVTEKSDPVANSPQLLPAQERP